MEAYLKELYVITEVDTQDNVIRYFRSGRRCNIAGYDSVGSDKRAMAYAKRMAHTGTYKIAKVTGLEFVEVGEA